MHQEGFCCLGAFGYLNVSELSIVKIRVAFDVNKKNQKLYLCCLERSLSADRSVILKLFQTNQMLVTRCTWNLLKEHKWLFPEREVPFG